MSLNRPNYFVAFLTILKTKIVNMFVVKLYIYIVKSYSYTVCFVHNLHLILKQFYKRNC